MRKHNWESLYKTYLGRRKKIISQGKEVDEKLSINEFATNYSAMEKYYRGQGYKTPTKNIIQNMTNAEIYYDWSFNQAKALRQYIVEAVKKKTGEDKKIKIYDIRHGTINIQGLSKSDIDELIRSYYQELKKEHPEWWREKNTIEARKRISETFFYGDSK